MRVEIWSDVVCPWCYIAEARFAKALAGFEHREHVEVVHRSFELDPGHHGTSVEPVPAFLARRFGPQGPAMDEQVAVRARREGLDYRTDRQVGSTLDAHRLLHWAKEQGRQQQLLRVLFDTNFGAADTIFTHPALIDAAARAGLDPQQAARILADAHAYLDHVREDERAATALGAQGVPFILIDGRHPISGAQSASTLKQALDTAWEQQPYPDPEQAEGAVCLPDGSCTVPGAQI